jgi:hypothetical protein
VTKLWAENGGIIVRLPTSKGIFFSENLADWFRGPPILLFGEYHDLFSRSGEVGVQG